MLQLYEKLVLYGLLIELFLQISCSANSTTNSIINTPQFDVDGHAHNQKEVIKRSTKLNLSENLNDEIKLESVAAYAHAKCDLSSTSSIDQDNFWEEEISRFAFYESKRHLEYMYRNGKKVLVDEEFQKMQYEFQNAYRSSDEDELNIGKPVDENLVTWVNKQYLPYEQQSRNPLGPRSMIKCRTSN